MPRPSGKNPYILKDGTPAPGVTSVLAVLNKPFLVAWANRMGLQGVNTEEYMQKQMRIGSLIHDAIHRDLQGQPVSFKPADNPDYTDGELAKGEIGFDAYCKWKAKHVMKPFLVEAPLVSEARRFGGTIDFYGDVDGRPMVLDFTAGKSIYSEKLTQTVAYGRLLEENGYQVDDLRVVRFPRDIDEGSAAEDRRVDLIDVRWELFLLCLEIYPLLKKVG